MAPRKKAAAAAATDGADAAPAPAARATRSSARTAAKNASPDAATDSAAAASSQDASQPAKAPASKAKAKAPASKAKTPASKAKGKAKRKRDDDADEDEDAGDDEPDAKKAKNDDDEAEKEKKKMVTVVKRGAAPVDPHSGMVDTHQVYQNSDGIWDAMLNQTDVGKNANKFYVIQLLHPIGNPSSCVLFTRWGRVGENGQKATKGPWDSASAVNQFKNQFKSKTATNWEQRHGMVAKKGKYTWLERSFEDEEESSKSDGKDKEKDSEEPEKVPDSKLPTEVQALCRLIFSTKLIEAHLSSMNYDAHKLPLGKLAKSTILNGFAALKTLSEVLQDPNCKAAKDNGGFQNAVATLTNQYYSIIPHVFGRNRPTIINSLPLLKQELDLVDALGDMEVASKLISTSVTKDPETGEALNPVDAHFRSLRLTAMDPVARTTPEFGTLEEYVRNTHGATHRMNVKVLNAFRVERREESDAFVAAGNDGLPDGERLLLWHGSRTTNFAGILKQGLRIAPPEAPVTGYMFGKGVYFADMMSKSANYCYAHLSNGTGLLLLCEVAAKPFYERTGAEYNADQGCKAANARATKGLGRTQPSGWQDAGEALENPALKGVQMPKGKPQDVSGRNDVHLQYNEYIVYDTTQIRLRYLLMVKMQ